MYLLDEIMGIRMKVIEKNMFFGTKEELFSLAFPPLTTDYPLYTSIEYISFLVVYPLP